MYAVPDHPQDDGQPPVQSLQMFVLQDGADGVGRHGGGEGGGEAGAGVIGEEHLYSTGADEAALREERCESEERERESLPGREEPVWRSRHGRTCRMPCRGPGE